MLDNKKIGERLKKVREHFSLTIEKIAEILQESPDTIRNIEDGGSGRWYYSGRWEQ